MKYIYQDNIGSLHKQNRCRWPERIIQKERERKMERNSESTHKETTENNLFSSLILKKGNWQNLGKHHSPHNYFPTSYEVSVKWKDMKTVTLDKRSQNQNQYLQNLSKSKKLYRKEKVQSVAMKETKIWMLIFYWIIFVGNFVYSLSVYVRD